MACDNILVFTTCESAKTAGELAARLVTDGLAACVNTIANVTSTYRWKDNVEQSQEFVLLIKTTSDRYDALEAAICQQSSYELPEVIAVPIDRGLPVYLQWIAASTRDKWQADAT